MKWPCPELDEVVHIRTGTINPLKHSEMEFELFSIPGFDIGSPEIKVGSEIMSNKNVVKPDDVLFSKLNPRIPRIWIVPKSKHRRQISSTEFWPLVCDQRLLSNHYLRYFLLKLAKEGVFSDSIEAATRSRSRIKPFHLLRQHIPLPPLSEQRRIVEILDQADALRKKRAVADAKAARILPALFYKMFGDPATNPKGWPVVELRALGTPLSGGGFPLEEQGHAEGEVPFIKVSDMNSPGNEVFIRFANHWVSAETLHRLHVKAAPAGTTIFPKIGAAVATNKKRLLLRETAYDNNVIGVVPHKPEWSTYIFAFFLLFDLRRLTRTTALPSIKTSELGVLPMPKPDQRTIQAFNTQFRRLLELQEAQRMLDGLINGLFDVLLHRAFTGDLTAKWREAHMKELLQEMEQQAKALKIDDFRLPIEGDSKSSIINHRSEIPHD